jgi:hypothetical protein
MTMLDDDRVASLLAGAAATFEVPLTGPDDILERALGRGHVDGDEGGDDDEVPPDAPGRVHRLFSVAARHRALSVAAVVVVLFVLAGVAGSFVRNPAHPTTSAGPAHTPVTVPARPAPASTTTTTPAFSANRSPQASAAAPSSAGKSSGAAQGVQNDTVPTTTPNAPNLPNGAVGQSAKIEQTGSLALTVGRDKLSRTITQLTALAGAYGGFVANSQTQSGGGFPSGSVTLQVPVQSFATVLARAEALGKTSGLTTKATDVTGQYVDLQSRITALAASRQQYLTILAKADTVGDVLAVQDQLNAIQSQIEQLQGQLQLLTSQTSYSTLTVTVGERSPAPVPSPLPESGLVRAWHASVGGFVTGAEGAIRIAGPLLFALLLVGAVLAGGRALWRRSQRRRL